MSHGPFNNVLIKFLCLDRGRVGPLLSMEGQKVFGLERHEGE